MIEVKNLTKQYNHYNAVDNISFSVKKGEIIGFLGPNGAGKTTTMKMLTCYIPPTYGKAEVDGLDVETHSIEVRKKIGYLPENAPLYMDMSVLDHIDFIAEVRHIPKRDRGMRIKEIVTACGLKTVVQKSVSELSKGYRQRLSLALSILHDPEILILDEPTSGLDPNQIVEIRELIKKLGQEKTVILSTHILPEVQATCSRVLIINEGKIVANGTPSELQENAQGGEEVLIKLKADSGAVIPALQGIFGIREVIQVSRETDEIIGYKIKCRSGLDVRESIFTTVVQNNWILFEMKKETVSLENIFRKLTAG